MELDGAEASAAAPALDRLRAATATAHRRLEGALDLLAAPLEQARFVAVLQMFEAFHRAWEPRVAGLIGDEGFLAPRRRLAHVRADLAALGAAPDPSLGFDLAGLDGAAAAWGSVYVVEGSTLGGLVIAKALGGAPWAPAGGLRYFSAHGRATAALWRDVVARLEQEAAREGIGGMVEGADRTFALMAEAAPRR